MSKPFRERYHLEIMLDLRAKIDNVIKLVNEYRKCYNSILYGIVKICSSFLRRFRLIFMLGYIDFSCGILFRQILYNFMNTRKFCMNKVDSANLHK